MRIQTCYRTFNQRIAGSWPSRITSAREGGMALVLVLGFLMLITGLVVAFFTSVTTELTSSSTTSSILAARGFAHSATQFVEGTIRTATSRGSNFAWASQPGMIRVYSESGSLVNCYKLFSGARMLEGSTYNPSSDLTGAPTDWNVPNALWTDLNSPVYEPDATNPQNPPRTIFPILDPRAKKADLNVPTSQGVEGFDFSVAYGAKASTGNDALLPMPVRWLYILQDGSMIYPDTGSSSTAATATFNTVPAERRPSKKNPIVGRVAFWTDDESCKININTASEGVYWDTPRVDTIEDRGVGNPQFGQVASQPGLALCQPGAGEFQRYPGHPATTCLSPVFGWLFGDPNRDTGGISAGNVARLQPYYEIAPRIAWGGSNGGTTVPPTTPVTLDQDRLYATIDELVFKADRTRNPVNRSLTQDVLDKSRFFITANSRAPEITLFNTPRVSLWPVWRDVGKRTAFDKLAAFCSHLGRPASANQEVFPYYFTRQNSRNSEDDYANIPRNQQLYSYLQALTSRPVPGFGGTFSGKYPAVSGAASERDQILTSIFDYIRCVNLRDPSTGATPFTKAPAAWNSSAAAYADSAGSGEVIPIRISTGGKDTFGFGRYNTVAELDLLFYGTRAVSGTTAGMRAVAVLKYANPMQGNIGYQPNLRYSIKGLDQLLISNTTGVQSSLFLPPGGSNLIEVGDNQTHHGRSMGGVEGPAMGFVTGHWNTQNDKTLGATGQAWNTDSTRQNHYYPFFSRQEIVLVGGTTGPLLSASNTFALSATGAITVEVRPADSNSNQVVQKLSFQVPTTPAVRVPAVSSVANFETRLRNISGNAGNVFALFRAEDTILGWEPAGPKAGATDSAATPVDDSAGDIRMIAARNDVPAKYFRPHEGWQTTGTTTGAVGGKAHALQSSLGLRHVGATFGTLVGGANYMNGADPERNPGMPSRIKTGVKNVNGRPGDWDTGIGVQKDGAYLNKPDEGDQQFVDLVGGGTRIPYFQKDDHSAGHSSIFSPNRQVPSAMMLGSIPTGVQRFRPWETLLFCSKPEDTTHPGRGLPISGPPYTTPPDHLLADLFWMPIVEPYAISEPLSTAGKVNMNYQLAPFGAEVNGKPYIRRDTAVRGVMKSTKFMALPVGDATGYKPHYFSGGAITGSKVSGVRRYAIDAQNTLDAGFEKRFKNNDIFRSATQICEVDLIPDLKTVGTGVPNMVNFWNNNTLTGDNLREKPYVDLYARLTTKSNTFTVHVRAQSLKKAVPNTAATTDARWSNWAESTDQVVGEYRGSSIIERYVDPNDAKLTDATNDFATKTAGTSTVDINTFYKFRTVSTKQIGQ